uniref:Uncharacterized protein n=1 Tax=Anguilla anguilla TaxID=7936 RepID=A0A0E9XDQ3_ANGAN
MSWYSVVILFVNVDVVAYRTQDSKAVLLINM